MVFCELINAFVNFQSVEIFFFLDIINRYIFIVNGDQWLMGLKKTFFVFSFLVFIFVQSNLSNVRITFDDTMRSVK